MDLRAIFITKGQGEGTALGLAAVFGTVLMHHGAVTAYRVEATGTVFRGWANKNSRIVILIRLHVICFIRFYLLPV